jgi:hypothetical protein
MLTFQQTQEFNNISTIVGASSSTCGEVVISLWAHKIIKERRTRDPPLTWSSFLLVILHIALILAAGGFIYQNTEFHVSHIVCLRVGSQSYYGLGLALAPGPASCPGQGLCTESSGPETRIQRTSPSQIQRGAKGERH